MVPKLVAEDIPLLHSLLSDVFPGVQYTRAEMGALRAEIYKLCTEMHLVAGEGDSPGAQWVEKVRRGKRDGERERERREWESGREGEGEWRKGGGREMVRGERRWRKRVRGSERGEEWGWGGWNLINAISHQYVVFILPPSSLLPGFTAVPDYPTAPRSDDGWSQW